MCPAALFLFSFSSHLLVSENHKQAPGGMFLGGYKCLRHFFEITFRCFLTFILLPSIGLNTIRVTCGHSAWLWILNQNVYSQNIYIQIKMWVFIVQIKSSLIRFDIVTPTATKQSVKLHWYIWVRNNNWFLWFLQFLTLVISTSDSTFRVSHLIQNDSQEGSHGNSHLQLHNRPWNSIETLIDWQWYAGYLSQH